MVFDLDGVVIDSMPLHTQAWISYLEGLGLRPSLDLVERMHGRRNDDIVTDFIAPDLKAEEVFAHGAAKERLFREMMTPELERHLVPGIRELLGGLNGTPAGLASNAEPANIDLVLDGLGLRQRFQLVVSGQEVARPKPHPDIYLRAAELLGVRAGNCIVFEDSPVGVSAGLAAGARVVGVETHPGELPGVALRIRDFLDPALGPWLEGLRAC